MLKAQVSFEFVIIMALVLGICLLVIIDFLPESSDTIVLSAVEVSAASTISELKMQDPSCLSTYIKSVKMYNESIILDIEGCSVPADLIISGVTKDICPQSSGFNSLTCYGKTYYVQVM